MTINSEHRIIDRYVKPGDLVLDIGANIGQWSEYIFEKFDTVNVRMFDAVTGRENDKILPLAFGREEGKMKFFDYGGDSQMGSFYYRGEDFDKIFGNQPPKEIEVDVTTIDDYCEKSHIDHVNFCKIDVEGAELDVLEGASRMLFMHAIDYLQIEYGETYKASGYTIKQIFDCLALRGYRLARIEDWGYEMVHDHDVEKFEDYRYGNFIAGVSLL